MLIQNSIFCAMKKSLLILPFLFGIILIQLCFADGIANQTASNTTAVTNTTTNTETSPASQDSEAINNFFKDADYEHLKEQKPYNFVDPGYLGGKD